MVAELVRTLTRKFEKHRQRGGVLGALRVCAITPYYLVRYYPEQRRDRAANRARVEAAEAFDRTYGTDTAQIVKLTSLNIAGSTWAHAGPYQGTHEPELYSIMDDLQVDHAKFVFVDIGSGKGKVLLIASKYPFSRIRGAEFSQELHEIAVENVKRYKHPGQVCSDIAAICMDATLYELPSEPCFLFLYNPFEATVMRTFIEHLDRTLEASPRPLILLYLNPRAADVVDGSRTLGLAKDAGRYRVYEANLDMLDASP
jgi:hypothetical protein